MKTVKPKSAFAVIEDAFGNKIIRKQAKIYLKLAEEDSHREIGYIDFKTGTFICRRRKSVHLHIKSNSYGFNHKIMTEAVTFDKVKIYIDAAVYLMPVEDIVKYGQFLFFKQKGFELQLFVPVEIIERYPLGLKQKPKPLLAETLPEFRDKQLNMKI